MLLSFCIADTIFICYLSQNFICNWRIRTKLTPFIFSFHQNYECRQLV